MLKSKEKKIMLSEKRMQVKIVIDWKTIGSKKVEKQKQQEKDSSKI